MDRVTHRQIISRFIVAINLGFGPSPPQALHDFLLSFQKSLRIGSCGLLVGDLVGVLGDANGPSLGRSDGAPHHTKPNLSVPRCLYMQHCRHGWQTHYIVHNQQENEPDGSGSIWRRTDTVVRKNLSNFMMTMTMIVNATRKNNSFSNLWCGYVCFKRIKVDGYVASLATS